PEARKNRKNMPEQRGNSQSQLQVDEQVFGGLKNAQPGQRHGRRAFQDIDDQHGYAGRFAQYPEGIGGAGVTAAEFPDIDVVEGFSDPYRGWDRSQQVSYE